MAQQPEEVASPQEPNAESAPTPDSPASAAKPAPTDSATHSIRVSSDQLSIGPEDWVRIEALTDRARAGWITGSVDNKTNTVTLDTEGVEAFTLIMSRLKVDWSRRVIVIIDDQRAELKRGDLAPKWFELTEAGRWQSLTTDTP